jgi:hypothetical protein
MKERSDSDENQIDREQQHPNIFCHHASFVKYAAPLCTLKKAKADAIAPTIPAVGWNALSELQHASAQTVGLVRRRHRWQTYRHVRDFSRSHMERQMD